MFECGFLLLDEYGSSFHEIRNVISSSTRICSYKHPSILAT